MKHIKSKIIFTVFLTTFLPFLLGIYALDGVAPSLEDLISAEQIAALHEGETPSAVQFGSPLPQLVPQNEFLRQRMEAMRLDLGPSVIVEVLDLYKKPASATMTGWTDDEQARLYNNLIAISSLAGVQYLSPSRNTMRTLYESSFVVDGPSSKKPVADPVFSQPPAELRLYTRQKDLTFGDNTYQYEFFAEPGLFIITQKNLTALTVGIFTAVGRNNLRSTVAVLDAGEYILVYAAAMVKAAALPRMRDRVSNSFTSRTKAGIQWFNQQADKAFANAD
ncbi:MAG: hypothetical protein FWD91_03675 [Treponema sp.]|nr:hypothetical protein [Treponema sp.]